MGAGERVHVTLESERETWGVRGLGDWKHITTSWLLARCCYIQSDQQGAGRFGVLWAKAGSGVPGTQDPEAWSSSSALPFLQGPWVSSAPLRLSIFEWRIVRLIVFALWGDSRL